MKLTRKVFGVIVVIVSVFLAAVYVKQYEQRHSTKVKEELLLKKQKEIDYYINTYVGTKIKNIVLTNSLGEKIELDSFENKPKLVMFWASWCSDCRKQWSNIQRLYGRFGEDIDFVTVNLPDGKKETIGSALEYMMKNNYSLPYYYDSELEAARIFEIKAIPTIILADEEGIIQDIFIESGNYEQLLKSLTNLVSN